MITFRISHPTYQNENSTLSLYFERFYIGSSSSCHLRFPNKENKIFLKATQLSDKFIIESVNNQSYTLNGIKYIGSKVCNIDDEIGIDNANIKILNIDLNKVYQEIDFAKKHGELVKNSSELLEVISALEKELLYSDQDIS